MQRRSACSELSTCRFSISRDPATSQPRIGRAPLEDLTLRRIYSCVNVGKSHPFVSFIKNIAFVLMLAAAIFNISAISWSDYRCVKSAYRSRVVEAARDHRHFVPPRLTPRIAAVANFPVAAAVKADSVGYVTALSPNEVQEGPRQFRSYSHIVVIEMKSI